MWDLNFDIHFSKSVAEGLTCCSTEDVDFVGTYLRIYCINITP